jgi:copper chaperone CopZ
LCKIIHRVMKNIFLLILAGFLFACSSDKVSHIPVSETIVEDADINQTLAEVTLTGMSCVHMCGGLIRKNVMAIPGVQEIEFDFSDDREFDIAKIKIDPSVDVKDIFATIEELNDGQFSIQKCDLTKWVNKDEDYRIGSLPIAVPNVFQVLSFVLKHD